MVPPNRANKCNFPFFDCKRRMTNPLEQNSFDELWSIRREIAVAAPKLLEAVEFSAEMVALQEQAGRYVLARKTGGMDNANLAEFFNDLMARYELAALKAYGVRPAPGEGGAEFILRVDDLMAGR